jgi:DNA polymerase III gamma/tau subunit
MDLTEFTKTLLNYLRQALLLKIMGEDGNPLISGLTKEEFQKLKEQSEIFKEEEIKKIIHLFLEAQTKMRYSPIPQLPLELAIIESCGLAE